LELRKSRILVLLPKKPYDSNLIEEDRGENLPKETATA
jgi:hypothetical protein